MRQGRVLSLLTGLTVPVTVAGLLTVGSGTAGASTAGAGTAGAGSAVLPGRAVPAAGAGPTLTATTKLALRRFVAAGTRAYVVGAEDGTFPPIGWHITGQMGGVWAPPVKLLDGVWFGIGGHWLANATSFTSGPGMVRMTFPVTGGLRPTLTEFAPDGLPTVLFGLTLVPANGQATTASLTADAHSQVAASYPWTFTKPTFDAYNHVNTVSMNNGVITFGERKTSWAAAVGATPAPAATRTGTGYWGPTPASQQTAFGTNGRGGQLTWQLPVPAGGRTLWLGVAGSRRGASHALTVLRGGLADPEGLLTRKIAERDAVAGLTDVRVPDASVQRAILWSKLNLADLRRTIIDAKIRDTKAGTVFPKPLATFPRLSGIDAAYPDYAEFFGVDGAYSTYGLAATGQWQTAMDQLNTMRMVSQVVNGGTGKVVHEITATGAVYYGDNTEPGDINETAQFAIAAGLLWQWTGDKAFLAQNYSFIKAGMHYLTGLESSGKDDLWPDGAGIVENPAQGIDALDVAAETVQALGALHTMARAMADPATATWASQRRQAMLAAFHQWWLRNQHLYADSMCDGTEGSCTGPGQKLQQRWFTSDSPMEQDIAPPAAAQAALTRMEGPTFTGSCGLYVDGVGGPMGTSGQTCYLLNTGTMAVAEANYGRTAQAAGYMDKIASQLTVEMPGALPELAAGPQYNPFEPFTSRANVMQAWSSYGLLWTTVHGLLGVSPNVPGRSVAVIPELPSSWHQLSVRDLRAGSARLGEYARHTGHVYRTVVTGAQGLSLTIGTVLAAGTTPRLVTLNGHRVQYRLVASHRGATVEVLARDAGPAEALTVHTAGPVHTAR